MLGRGAVKPVLVEARFHNEFLTGRLLGTVLRTLCTRVNRTGSPFTDGTLEVWRGRNNRPPSCSPQVRSRGSHPDSGAPGFMLLATILGNLIGGRSGVSTGAVEVPTASRMGVLAVDRDLG